MFTEVRFRNKEVAEGNGQVDCRQARTLGRNRNHSCGISIVHIGYILFTWSRLRHGTTGINYFIGKLGNNRLKFIGTLHWLEVSNALAFTFTRLEVLSLPLN